MVQKQKNKKLIILYALRTPFAEFLSFDQQNNNNNQIERQKYRNNDCKTKIVIYK